MARTLSLLFTLLIITLHSCQKETEDDSSNDLIQQIKVQLAKEMQGETYNKVNFHKVILSQSDSITLIRIPFLKESMAEHFVLLKMDKATRNSIADAAIISMPRDNNERTPTHFFKYSLNGTPEVVSTITDGYIDAYRPLLRGESMMDPYKELPAVIVTASYADVYQPTGYLWYQLDALLHINSGSNGSSAYYGSADPAPGSSYTPGGYSGGAPVPAVQEETMMEFEKEYVYSKLAIDIRKFFNCFDNISSIGATYTMTLCADVPSNTNPNASADNASASAGHSFLTIVKTNGNEKVTQSFGFYPKDLPSKTETFDKIASELHDNGSDEINASFLIKISESQFQTIKSKAIELSSRSYELGDFNCTDYAVDVFNSVRTIPLVVPQMTIYLPGTPGPYIPGNSNSVTINKSPQMLFAKLKNMKDKNSPDASSIRIDLSKNYRSPISKGACN